jgi:hypothetical protein
MTSSFGQIMAHQEIDEWIEGSFLIKKQKYSSLGIELAMM